MTEPPPAPFWLAHHYPEDYRRCYPIGSVRICARCAGLYPALLAGLALQIGLGATTRWPREEWIVLALTLPAVADWAIGRFDPASGTNLIRSATGILLGVALSRTIYLNMVHPANWLSVTHFAGLAVIAGIVEVLARPHRLRKRLERGGPLGVEGPKDFGGPRV